MAFDNVVEKPVGRRNPQRRRGYVKLEISMMERKEKSEKIGCRTHIQSYTQDSDSIQLLALQNSSLQFLGNPEHDETSGPHILERSKNEWYLHLSVDVVFLILPLPFLAIAFIVTSIDEKPIGDGTAYKRLVQVINVAVTLFPYCFAAVFSRAAMKCASWKLENGASIGMLEQLNASRSLLGTMTAFAQIRSFNVISIGLVFLWCLSPLGGQALLHILTMTEKSTQKTTYVSYINTRGDRSPGTADGWSSQFNALYGASLLAPTTVKQSAVDSWGNVKIPYQSRIPGPSDSDGWRMVDQNKTGILDYSSLFGVPVDGFFTEGNTTFRLESTYMELDCHNMNTSMKVRNNNQRPGWPDELDSEFLLSTGGPYITWRNRSKDDPWVIGYRGFDASRLMNSSQKFGGSQAYLDFLPTNLPENGFERGTLLFQDWTGVANVTNIFCSPTQAYVESEIKHTQHGISQEFSVIRQRYSKLPHSPTNISMLALPSIWRAIGNLLPNTTRASVLQSQSIQLTNNYLFNQDAAYVQSATVAWANQEESPFLRLSMDAFGRGLSQLLNSCTYSTMYDESKYLTGVSLGFDSTSKGLVLFHPSWTPPSNPSEMTEMIRNATTVFTVVGNSTIPWKAYKSSIPWVTLLSLASYMMFMAAIAGVVYGRRTITPDYLGYVSSLIQESRFAGGLEGGVHLNGLERSMLMKDRVIKYGDIDLGQGEIGVLAVTDRQNVQHVTRGKLYIAFPK